MKNNRYYKRSLGRSTDELKIVQERIICADSFFIKEGERSVNVTIYRNRSTPLNFSPMSYRNNIQVRTMVGNFFPSRRKRNDFSGCAISASSIEFKPRFFQILKQFTTIITTIIVTSNGIFLLYTNYTKHLLLFKHDLLHIIFSKF